MIKWLGMGLVLAGSAGLGMWYALLYARRGKNLSACRRAMVLLRGEIAYGRTPLPAALFQAAGRTGGTVSHFLREVSDRLERGGGTMEDIWGSAVEEIFTDREMGEQERRELKSLGDTLGYLDAEMQIQTINLYLQRLEQSLEEYEREKRNRTRLYPLLGAMCGALICIIMV